MNPLTLGIYLFHEQLRLLLGEPPPGRTMHATARLTLDGADDKMLVQAIRLFENKSANLHSFSLHTGELIDEQQFLANARRQLQGDMDSVRACFTRAGEEVAAESLPELGSVDAFARAVASLAQSSAGYLDGIVVGLLPSRVEEGLLQRCVRALSGVAKHPRLVILARDDGSDWLKRVVPHEVTLRVDQRALWQHLRSANGATEAGPRRDDAPRLTGEALIELEKKVGRRILTEDNGRVLRNLLLDAGEAFAEGHLDRAAKKFRLARTYCQMLGLHAERATCAISIGTARFASGNKELALRAYEEGREIAARYDLRSIEMQAHLGIASTLLAMRRHGEAREAYERCREAAKGRPGMQVECGRMRGLSFALEGRPGDAVLAWLDALDAVELLPPLERAQTPYRAITDHLADELPKAARKHEVAGIQQRASRIAAEIARATDEARAAAVSA